MTADQVYRIQRFNNNRYSHLIYNDADLSYALFREAQRDRYNKCNIEKVVEKIVMEALNDATGNLVDIVSKEIAAAASENIQAIYNGGGSTAAAATKKVNVGKNLGSKICKQIVDGIFNSGILKRRY